MLNLILFDQPSWLFLQLIIREHFLCKGEQALLLCDCDTDDSRGLQDALQSVGLASGIDYVLTGDLNEYCQQNDVDSAELIVFCYENHLRRCPSIFDAIDKPLKGKFLSYYADSYVNIFACADIADRMFQEHGDIAPRVAYSFDSTRPTYVGSLGWIEHRVIRSESIHAVMKRYSYYKELVADHISALRTRYGENRVYLLLVMRPWGLESFHEGIYRLKNGAADLGRIVRDMVERIIAQLGEDTIILYRTDSRSRDSKNYMGTFESCLKQEGLPGAEIVDLAEFWPQGITIEPYIYYFEELSGGSLNTAVFDSTTTLPFYTLGLVSRHYMGANAELTAQLQLDPRMTDYFQHKVSISESHLAAVTTRYSYKKQELVNGLLCYERMPQDS